MSLADELVDDDPREPSPTEAWIKEWFSTLSDVDKATFEHWAAGTTPIAPMHRALQRRGYPCNDEALRRWRMKHRDAS